MRRLAIETATAACSVALFDGDTCIAFAHEIVGRGHAERLVPMIATLVGGGRADAIFVDVGPGSFTGIRVGISAARALGFAWDVPVTGYGSLALIAALDGNRDDTQVAIEGGHGELFVVGGAIDEACSLPFEAAVAALVTERIVGNAAERVVRARGWGTAVAVDLDARALPCLDPAQTSLAPRPLYLRGADAKPMA